MTRIEVLKPTENDWHGSYTINGWYRGVENQMFVRCVFNGYINPPGEIPDWRTPVWRTSVWGNDDYGLEFDCDTEEEAWNMFLKVVNMKYVNRSDLIDLGFV